MSETNKRVMKEFDTYIFDLDGTLLSTLNDLAASTNYALRWAGMPEHTIEEIRMFVGNGVKLLMERAIPNGQNNPKFEITYNKFREHYMQHSLDTTSPYNGIPELLYELKRRGKKLRYGDVITIPSEELEITIIAPTTNEIEEHQKEVAEKARVAAIVKKMNQDNKKKQKAHPSKEGNKTKRKPVRFPGT